MQTHGLRTTEKHQFLHDLHMPCVFLPESRSQGWAVSHFPISLKVNNQPTFRPGKKQLSWRNRICFAHQNTAC